MPKRIAADERRSAIDLMTLLLKERCHRIASDDYSEAYHRHLQELCSVLLWKHTEARGKYEGCKKWSIAAVNSFNKYGRVVTNKKRYPINALRHEHLFPRKQLIEKLFQLRDPTHAEVKQLLESLNIGVVVTVAEDARLDSMGIEDDIWARYRKANIEIYNGEPP